MFSYKQFLHTNKKTNYYIDQKIVIKFQPKHKTYEFKHRNGLYYLEDCKTNQNVNMNKLKTMK